MEMDIKVFVTFIINCFWESRKNVLVAGARVKWIIFTFI